MDSFIPNSISDWQFLQILLDLNFGAELSTRFIVIISVFIVVNILLLAYLVFFTDTSPKQVKYDVFHELKLWKDFLIPLLVLLVINFIEFLYWEPKNSDQNPISHQLLHLGMEFLLVITTYYTIIVFEFTIKESELKHDAGFWKNLREELKKSTRNLIGIHTTDLRRMFEPLGLKYFQTTLTAFKKSKAIDSKLEYHRILLIHSNKHENSINTWLANAVSKVNQLTKSEQQFQLYMQLHKENNVHLHVITQKKLHKLLVSLKSDSSLLSDEKNELENICPSNITCRKIKRKKLDSLIINGKCYNTSPSFKKGLNFFEEKNLTKIVTLLSQSIIDDRNNLSDNLTSS